MTTAAQRIEDLLVQDATEGLAPENRLELDRLLPDQGFDPETFLLAAAAVELAYTETDEPLPTDLRSRVHEQAQEFYDSRGSATTRETRQPTGRVVAFPPVGEPAPEAAPRSVSPGWWVAAAAVLVAVIGWWPRLVGTDAIEVPPAIAEAPAAPVVPTTAEPTIAEERDALISQAQDLVRIAWTATEDPAASGASGDVVWSTAEQRGYLRFIDLAVNDPDREQYQLWIFDVAQDERYPVDGGVFDVTSSGEVVVAIDSKLAIQEPTLFAITVEKPGGVVVSSRERLPLLAQVG